VCLSTDKAVYPINAMGMSKALMEKTALSFARNNEGGKTKIAVTRYGNVMYSRGSVIPLFISQIKSRKPVTITDPHMTRFLMSLQESVDLVKYAFSNSQTGDLFVRKAPAATVEVLLKALIELFDAQNTEILNIGTRHGEMSHY
jgi:UDP-glucose 4-epimerase